MSTFSFFWNWVTTDAAGFFTFLLVLVAVTQAGLFVWQLRYMRKSISDTKELALAARASAETAKEQVAITRIGVIDLERAYLAVGPTQITVDFVPDAGKARGHFIGTDPQQLTVKLIAHNTGRTAATIKRVFAQFSNLLPMGDTPVYEENLVQPILTNLSLSAGNQAVLDPFNFVSEFVGPQFFWGYIEYTDIFKNNRTSRFCTRLVPTQRGTNGKYEIAGGPRWSECD